MHVWLARPETYDAQIDVFSNQIVNFVRSDAPRCIAPNEALPDILTVFQK